MLGSTVDECKLQNKTGSGITIAYRRFACLETEDSSGYSVGKVDGEHVNLVAKSDEFFDRRLFERNALSKNQSNQDFSDSGTPNANSS